MDTQEIADYFQKENLKSFGFSLQNIKEKREFCKYIFKKIEQNIDNNDFIQSFYEANLIDNCFNFFLQICFEKDSIIYFDNEKIEIRIGKGSFEIKEHLKSIDFKFGKIRPMWSKEYKKENILEVIKDFRFLNLI
jgi:hypothetical protein